MARSNLAHLLLELGRPAEARDFARDAVRLLTRCAPAGPEPVITWARMAAGHYLRAVEELGEEPDAELIVPFLVA